MPDTWFVHRLSPARIWLLWLVYWVALFAIMHTPREHLPRSRVSYLDTVAHFTGYALLTLLGGVYAQRSRPTIPPGWYAWCVVVYGAYAALDELTQPYFHRTASVYDWLTDMTAVLVALAVVRLESFRTRSRTT